MKSVFGFCLMVQNPYFGTENIYKKRKEKKEKKNNSADDVPTIF